MQTFLPYSDYDQSAKVLDRQRLGKQRVETLQLLKALAGQTKGWRTHPAALMWRGYERQLALYGLSMCAEWIARGYQDTCAEKITALAGLFTGSGKPDWLGERVFHASHRSNLLRKDHNYYSQFNWSEPDDLPYVWPVS